VKDKVDMLPSLVEAPERDAWLDMYSAASAELQHDLNMTSACEGAVPLLACRKLPMTEFNRTLMLEDSENPPINELVSWLELHAADQWALQIAESKHTDRTRAKAQDMGLASTGAGWSKLIAPTGDVHSERTSTDLHVSANNGLDFGNVVAQVYGLSDPVGDWLSSLAQRRNWHLFVVHAEGEIAGAAAMFVREDWAWFGVDATVARFRGRGVQSSLIAERARAAMNLGIRYITAETGLPESVAGKHTSRDNYLRSGFTQIYKRLNYKRAA
jgi:GNAT superfamily N-acetyltransferase